MCVVKLIDCFGNVSDFIMVNNEAEMREAARELALNINIGEKIIIE